MKKYLLITMTAAILIACGSTQNSDNVAVNADRRTQAKDVPPPPPPPAPMETGQRDPKAPNDLYGMQEKIDFLEAPFATWFESGYDAYEPDEAILEDLRDSLDDIEIMTFMGTWCGDSKREVPKLYKLLEASYYDLDNLEMIAVRRGKKDPVELVAPYDILRVPAIILFKDGEEIGRFVESPQESLEEDLLKIATGQPYKHSYED